MRILAWPLGLLLALPAPAVAETAPPAPPPAEASQRVSPATAAALARVVAPLEISVAAEIEQARKAIVSLPTVDEDAKQLEADYPGLYAALWTEIEPEMRRQATADYPAYWAALERLYLNRLTETEAQGLMRFFRSPTGQKLIRNMYGGIDATPIFNNMVRTENYAVDEQQMKAVTDAAKANAVKQIGPEDHADLWILMASIKLEKFQALGAETQKLTLDWVNKEDPEADEQLGKMMQEVMERYMAAHPPK